MKLLTSAALAAVLLVATQIGAEIQAWSESPELEAFAAI